MSLARAGWEVTLVESNAAKVAAGRRDGMSLEGFPAQPARFENFDEWSAPAETPVLLCVKTFDNAAVLRRIPDSRFLVPIQNGYDPQLEQLDHPAEAIASFVSHCPADRPAARITRAGSLHIGPRREASGDELARIDALAAALAKGGIFPVERVIDVRPYKSTKLMYNAAISPLAAGAGVDNAELLSDPLARGLFFGLLRENYTILRRAGLSMERIGPFHPDTVMRILRTPLLPALMGHFFRPSLRGTYCSMSPDMGSGRTEVDAYNGHLVRLAGPGPCPINQAVVALVERISRERLAPAREHLRQLAGMLPAGALA
ncbi:MAG: ketopantoate reductase family protein [Planctomycetes bacterium]|nr:ketopantoate reductase family protein [Planctomycetota bacterium]